VGRTTPSDQRRARPLEHNPAVARHVDLTRTDGGVVCRAGIASSFLARLRGLMLTASLTPGTGLLFPRTSSVHTHFMRYPIDVVFLDAEGRVVSIRHSLRPWRFASCRGASSVLELPAGASARLGLAEGDVLS
jgi:uncharacterized membrane protein (UPF0127 family)